MSEIYSVSETRSPSKKLSLWTRKKLVSIEHHENKLQTSISSVKVIKMDFLSKEYLKNKPPFHLLAHSDPMLTFP